MDYLTQSWDDKGVHTFPKGICPKINDWSTNSLTTIPQSIALTITPRGHPDSNEGVLCIPQSSSITAASSSDCFVLYPGHSLGVSYPSAEMKSVYSTPRADRGIAVFSVFPVCLHLSSMLAGPLPPSFLTHLVYVIFQVEGIIIIMIDNLSNSFNCSNTFLLCFTFFLFLVLYTHHPSPHTLSISLPVPPLSLSLSLSLQTIPTFLKVCFCALSLRSQPATCQSKHNCPPPPWLPLPPTWSTCSV